MTTDSPSSATLIETDEPCLDVQLGETRITLLGTAHISQASADAVERMLQADSYDGVAIELCPSRYQAIMDPDSLSRMDLFQVIKDGKAAMITASLALGAYQQRMAEQFGIEPGAEMRAAIRVARERNLDVLLVDREIGVTLKRVYRLMPWWKRWTLMTGLLASVMSTEEVSETDVENLKQGDMLENTFSQFADQEKDLFHSLIAERDRYMAARIIEEVEGGQRSHILAVVGAGHLKGIGEQLKILNGANAKHTIEALDTIPPSSPWPGRLPWLIVGLVFFGLYLGFQRSPDLGWEMVTEWVVINGGLSALGALLAAAHPLTILGAFLAAPLTSLNPTIGAGMVTALIEVFLRKPKVGDFSTLRHDTTKLAGWWQNRVSRILLVFLFSTIGSAIGTYVAGFRIFDKLS